YHSFAHLFLKRHRRPLLFIAGRNRARLRRLTVTGQDLPARPGLAHSFYSTGTAGIKLALRHGGVFTGISLYRLRARYRPSLFTYQSASGLTGGLPVLPAHSFADVQSRYFYVE
ncbi:hypothetical protein, partial [Klebsiella oxytoca]